MTAPKAPYLRRAGTDSDLPTGWSTHPAGRFDGVNLEITFDPGRHDVCHALTALAAALAAGIASDGWRLLATLDGGSEVWVRERSATIRARLAGLRCVAATEAPGR